MVQLAVLGVVVLIALILYIRRPPAYVSFCLWVWFAAALVRRLVDWKTGWHDQNFILLAPHLVTILAALSLIVPSRRRPSRPPLAILLCMGGVFYGFVIGMLLTPSTEVAYGMLNWFTPLLLGAHLAMEWPQYQENRDVIMKTFLWAAGLLGGYGIYQYFVAPAWDVFWLENLTEGLIDPSFGRPEPLMMRVWSTSNSPGTFAVIMMAALIFLIVSSSKLKVPFAIAGYLSFLLTIVRAAWLGWVLGLVLVLRRARPQLLVRIAGSFIILAALLIPILSSLPDIATLLTDRFSSFTNLKGDGSLLERQDMYRTVAVYIAHEPFGHGLRSQESIGKIAIDSGVLATVLSLGWAGTLLYWAGVLIATRQSGKASPGDMFITACRAIGISLIAQYVGANVFINIGGILFWLCMGSAFAATEMQRSRNSVAKNQTYAVAA